MKVRMLVAIAGADFNHIPGEVVEFAPDEAQRLIDSGLAVLVEQSKPEAKSSEPVKSGKPKK